MSAAKPDLDAIEACLTRSEQAQAAVTAMLGVFAGLDPIEQLNADLRALLAYARALEVERDQLLKDFTGMDAADWEQEGKNHAEFLQAEDRGGGMVVCPDCGGRSFVDGAADIDLSPRRCVLCELRARVKALEAERDDARADAERLLGERDAHERVGARLHCEPGEGWDDIEDGDIPECRHCGNEYEHIADEPHPCIERIAAALEEMSSRAKEER